MQVDPASLRKQIEARGGFEFEDRSRGRDVDNAVRESGERSFEIFRDRIFGAGWADDEPLVGAEPQRLAIAIRYPCVRFEWESHGRRGGVDANVDLRDCLDLARDASEVVRPAGESASD